MRSTHDTTDDPTETTETPIEGAVIDVVDAATLLEFDADPVPADAIAPRPRRRKMLIALSALAVTLLAGGAWAGAAAMGAPAAEPAAPVQRSTAAVELGDLAVTQRVQGSVGYGTPMKVTLHRPGTITWLPAPGTVIHRGEPLARVDEQNVPLFLGETPLFRRLDASGMTGKDVGTVAQNLIALGYLDPSWSGETTGPRFAAALGRWREANGLGRLEVPPPAGTEAPTGSASGGAGAPGGTSDAPSTDSAGTADDADTGGTPPSSPPPPPAPTFTMQAIDPGDVFVHSGDLRVSGVPAQLGAPADGAVVIEATGTTKIVTVGGQELQKVALVAGDEVTITVAGGGETTGTVRSVSSGSGEGDDGGAAIEIADQTVLDGIEGGTVTVTVTTQRVEQVPSVPLSALVALAEGGYAVETEDGTLLAVQTGLFTEDRVEISGDGITAGLKVVTGT